MTDDTALGLVLTGKVLGVNTRTFTPKTGQTWDPFDKTTVRVFTGRSIAYLEASPDFTEEAQGLETDSTVALEVGVSAYVGKDGKPRTQYVAYRRAGALLTTP